MYTVSFQRAFAYPMRAIGTHDELLTFVPDQDVTVLAPSRTEALLALAESFLDMNKPAFFDVLGGRVVSGGVAWETLRCERACLQ